MLVEFRVKNFLSYKNETVLSMVADKNRELSDTNVFKHASMSLLKIAAIFGANASGKTNLIQSMEFLNGLLHPNKEIDYSELPSFKLDNYSENKPSMFEVTFYIGNTRYRYGVEVDREGIFSEWLFFAPNRQEACLFEREKNEITRTGVYFGNKRALDYIKPDPKKPFLFTLAQESVREFDWAKKIHQYLIFYIRSTNIPDSIFERFIQVELFGEKSTSQKKNIVSKEKIIQFLRDADFGISDISVVKVKEDHNEIIEAFLEVLRSKGQDIKIDQDLFKTLLHHKKYNENNEYIDDEKFPLEMESSGTIRFFRLLYPIFYVLHKGGILLVDEIESSLHPLLCERIVRLFNDKESNPKNAQLIFTTHNTLLMRPDLLRRDQIFFTDKDSYGVSTLYSLYDIDINVRNNFNYMNNYLSGRFGAIPYLGMFLLKGESSEEENHEAQT